MGVVGVVLAVPGQVGGLWGSSWGRFWWYQVGSGGFGVVPWGSSDGTGSVLGAVGWLLGAAHVSTGWAVGALGRFWWYRVGSGGLGVAPRGGSCGYGVGCGGFGAVLGAMGWLLRAVHWGDSVGPFIGAVHGGTGGVLGAAPVRFRFGSGVPTWASWRKPGCSAGRKTPLMATWSPGCARRVFSPSSSTARQRGR